MVFGHRSRNERLAVQDDPFSHAHITGIAVFLAVTYVLDAVLYDGIHTRAVMSMMWQIGLGMKLVG